MSDVTVPLEDLKVVLMLAFSDIGTIPLRYHGNPIDELDATLRVSELAGVELPEWLR